MAMNQKGSILVTVLALSVIMTVAGGALLMTIGNAVAGESDSLQRTRCYYDAESGLQLGAGWLQHQTTPWSLLGGTLLTAANLDNGCAVTVDIEDMVDPAIKRVNSEAVSGSTRIRLTWEVNLVAGYAYDAIPKVWPNKWRSLAD